MFVCLYFGLLRFLFYKIVRIKMLPHLPSFLQIYRFWTCPWRIRRDNINFAHVNVSWIVTGSNGKVMHCTVYLIWMSYEKGNKYSAIVISRITARFIHQLYWDFELPQSFSNTAHACLNPFTPELHPSAQCCLTRFFTGDFASWIVHFVNICVKNQQMQQLFIQFINNIR
jgi:hypothetical protein